MGFEHPRLRTGAGHTVATRLDAGVHDVICTRFFAPITHERFSRCPSKISDHVIMSFNIIVLHIKSFSGVYLPFKHDVITVQTVVNNYLTLPKVLLGTD